MLMKSPTQSLTGQLSARISKRIRIRIRNRLLAPGVRLSSVRQCAQQNGVSPSTVVAAYDQLLAQGLVQARKKRGFFVRESSHAAGADARFGDPAPGSAQGLTADAAQRSLLLRLRRHRHRRAFGGRVPGVADGHRGDTWGASI